MESEQSHRDQAASRLSPMGRKFFNLIEFDADEELVLEIRKHPFGLFMIEATGIIVAVMVALACIILSFNLDNLGLFEESSSLSGIRLALVGLGLFLSLGVLIIMIIGMIIYRNNVIYVTNEKLAQVIYSNIISRKISQLSIGDIQDVTVHQNSIFARLFNYGTLVVETAGEQQNYTFSFVPHPYETARGVVGAHEKNLRLYGN